MALLMNDPSLEKRILARRRAWGGDRYDEVWDGVYVMSPLANDEHQDIGNEFSCIFRGAYERGQIAVRKGINVSDRVENWKKNYRVPDVAVRLSGGKAQILKTHWLGGPDFVVEIVSKRDKTREKFDFYSKIGVRELLIVDRYPWALELYRLIDDKLTLVGKSTASNSDRLEITVLPFAFRLVLIDEICRIQVQHLNSSQEWTI